MEGKTSILYCGEYVPVVDFCKDLCTILRNVLSVDWKKRKENLQEIRNMTKEQFEKRFANSSISDKLKNAVRNLDGLEEMKRYTFFRMESLADKTMERFERLLGKVNYYKLSLLGSARNGSSFSSVNKCLKDMYKNPPIDKDGKKMDLPSPEGWEIFKDNLLLFQKDNAKEAVNLIKNLCDEMAEVARQLEGEQSVSENNLRNTDNGKDKQDIQKGAKDDCQIF